VNAITALGNPAIWIAAVAALSYIAVHWYRQRTQNSGLILLGLAAGYVPWLMYLNRTTFQFYTIVFLPWMLLALGLWFKLMFDSAEDKARVRSRIRAFLVLAMAMSLFFSNIWFGYTTDYWYWHIHMWLPSWI
jgi:dolichyl-phosphate-mannose--protein O-mannosyl transferase